MNKTQLDKEEQEILDAFESEEFKSDLTSARKKFIEKSAAQAFKKDKKNQRHNIRQRFDSNSKESIRRRHVLSNSGGKHYS
jgi:hypothetical protein